MAAAKVHGVSTRCNRHGLQRLIGFEVSCFPGEHTRDVVLHRHECRNEQVTVAGANLNRKVGAERRIACGVHLIRATHAKLGERRFITVGLNLRSRGAQSGGRDRGGFASRTSSHLCATVIGANPQLARWMEIPEPYSHRLWKSSMRSFGSVVTAQLSIDRRTQQEQQTDGRQQPLHFRAPFADSATPAPWSTANAANISRATLAASVPPCPFSRNTTSTISGFSTGAYPANHAGVHAPSSASAVPDLPATFMGAFGCAMRPMP